MQDLMLGNLSLGKQLGPDHPTLVGRRCVIVITEPRSGCLTNSQIAKQEKGK